MRRRCRLGVGRQQVVLQRRNGLPEEALDLEPDYAGTESAVEDTGEDMRPEGEDSE